MNVSPALKVRPIIAYARRLFAHMHEIGVTTLAASVSYYAMLASVPLLGVLLTVSAQLLPALEYGVQQPGVGNVTASELISALGMLLPSEASGIIQTEIARLQSQPPVGILS